VSRLFLIAGSLSAALSVALGAAGMHVFREMLAENGQAGWFPVALQYHQFHSLALIAVGLLLHRASSNRWLMVSAGLFLCGLLLFCLNLYFRAIVGWHQMRALVPFGGMAFIVGWLCLAVGAYRLNKP
jgi:uncharacterized membrane protein YgdD (TMEM256/DUF423 family)